MENPCLYKSHSLRKARKACTSRAFLRKQTHTPTKSILSYNSCTCLASKTKKSKATKAREDLSRMLAIHLNRLGCFVARARACVCGRTKQKKRESNCQNKTLLSTKYHFYTHYRVPSRPLRDCRCSVAVFRGATCFAGAQRKQSNERSSLCGVPVGCTL